MAEELNTHLNKWGINSAYIHSGVETLDRIQILDDLRNGACDVLVGVNLLREGLDLPEVSLVAILDADKEGFLRNCRSLTQTAGRAARNVHGTVIMYADKITDSMQRTIDETESRRARQIKYNEEHGIVPTPIIKQSSSEALLQQKQEDNAKNKGKKLSDMLHKNQPRPYIESETPMRKVADPITEYMNEDELKATAEKIKADMVAAAKRTDFIEAAALRDELLNIQEKIENMSRE